MRSIFLILSIFVITYPMQARADHCGRVIPGDLSKESQTEYESDVMKALQNYQRILTSDKTKAAEARKELIKTIRLHPEQVNDYVNCCDTVGSVLSRAVQLNDAELVELLLDLGAYPALPTKHTTGSTPGLFDSKPLVGEEYDMRIVRLVSRALSQWPVFEKMRTGELKTVKPEHFQLALLPPTSPGVGQGFSRKPVKAFFDVGKQKLVMEECVQEQTSEGATVNKWITTQFVITEFGNRIFKSRLEMAEGDAQPTLIYTTELKNIAPDTYREYLHNGECRIYNIQADRERATVVLHSLRETIYNADDQIIAENTLYNNPPIREQETPEAPLIVEPPTSHGMNRGFSRRPLLPFYDKQEGILVMESIIPTQLKKEGNNSRFIITEYYVSRDGKYMLETRREVLEGRDHIANTVTTVFENDGEPFVFRRVYDDGSSARYIVKTDYRGIVSMGFEPAEGNTRMLYERRPTSFFFVPDVEEKVSSQGVNQGFSREPAAPYYNKEKHTLVLERIGRMPLEHPNGNNRKFEVTRIQLLPGGKDMRLQTHYLQEGAASYALQEEGIFPRVEENTYRAELGDGHYCLYRAVFTPEGELDSLTAEYYTHGSRACSQLLYSTANN